jgi:hypothetical protein
VVDFIEEVEEQLRSDRYRSLALKAGPWFIALLVGIVAVWLAVWGYDIWRDRNIAAASVAYDKALTELSQGDQTGAYNDFGPIAATGPAGYKTLALLQQGNIRLTANKDQDAAALFDRAAQAAPNAILRDLAHLRAALALMDVAPYAQLQTRLTALIGDKRPFDLQAREALAMAKLAAGKTAEARNDFNALTITLGVTQAMRTRAQAAMALIDSGEVPAALAAAKAAATMPPPKPGTFGGSGPGQPGSDTSSSQGAAAPQDQGASGTPQ